MQLAETVTFGGSGLNRAAELRDNSGELKKLAASPDSISIFLCGGKPLIDTNLQRAAPLPVDMPLPGDVVGQRIFLGRENGVGYFGFNLQETFLKDATLLDHLQFAELRDIMAHIPARDAELIVTAKALFNWHASHRFCAFCGKPTQITMASWQRRCPVCTTSHFPRTDPVVIMLITQGNDLLLGRSPEWPQGMYSLLAGFVEPGETLEAAVRREVWEEAAVRVGEVSYLASQPWPFPTSLMIGCRGIAQTRAITLDKNELADALWVSREDVSCAFAGHHPNILPFREGSIARFLIHNWLSDTLG